LIVQIKHEDLEAEYNYELSPIGWVSNTKYAYHEIAGEEKIYKTINFA
jgi:hypothetical protein